MGGARSPKELKEFLTNMFLDKRIIASKIRFLLSRIIPVLRYKKVWKNYELINGTSLYDITEELSKKMQKISGKETIYSMRYTKPFLNEVIHKYDEVTLLPMYPQYSTTTVESVLDELKDTNYKGKITIIKPFYKDIKFNNLLVKSINNAVENTSEWHLIFSAHGIPKKIMTQGDVYQKQIEKQVEILKELLPNFKSISLAYQSKIGPSEWLKPYLEDEIPKYSNKKLLVYPLSFLIDNSETDYELKIEYGKVAKNYNLQEYKVVTCLNDDIDFAKYLIELSQN